MTRVKGQSPKDAHVLALMGGVLEHFRDLVAQEDWGRPLRTSHFRLLGQVPAEGITVTDLAERLGVTKQGCGQLVTGMVEMGLVVDGKDPRDGRVRLVTLTPEGRRTRQRFEQRVAEAERAWADAVGPRRYATFRAVLHELAGSVGGPQG
jgi:DNA-binding MarR family transcriptional regulator